MSYPSSRLTRMEEQVMQILWRLGPSYVKEVRVALSGPLPALTTVSTIVRILEQKGFVGYEPIRRSYCYHALVTQDEYRRFSLYNLLSGYFNGSFGQLVSFFAREENLDLTQLETLLSQTCLIRDIIVEEDPNILPQRPALVTNECFVMD